MTENQFIYYAPAFFFVAVSVFFGLMDGALREKCAPKSIMGAINIPYRAACEFTKPRWNLEVEP